MEGPWVFRIIMQALERVYVWAESHMQYPDDHTILGIPIDKDLQQMDRRELCAHIEEMTPAKGSFWKLKSTTKIRFGTQMMRDLHQHSSSESGTEISMTGP